MCKISIASLRVSVFPTNTLGGFIQWEMSSDDKLSSNTSSSCDVESLQLGVGGEGSLNSIVQRYRVGSWKKET